MRILRNVGDYLSRHLKYNYSTKKDSQTAPPPLNTITFSECPDPRKPRRIDIVTIDTDELVVVNRSRVFLTSVPPLPDSLRKYRKHLGDYE